MGSPLVTSPATSRQRPGTTSPAWSRRTTAYGAHVGAWAYIKNPAAYQKALVELPDWRIGCIFTGKGHRGQGVARAAVSAVVDAIREAGGGLVEAYPEQVEGREPQRGAYFHTGPESLFVATAVGSRSDRVSPRQG